MAKDLFSNQARTYARYRPTYPQELFDYILQHVPVRDRAWDCATGNGQAARVLADYFKRVDATDISEAQLANAVQKESIHYAVAPAEHTSFHNDSFDLITVATAYHWFDWNGFRREATRVGKPGAVVAVWAYHIIQPQDERIAKLIHHFYFDIVKTYWDPERRHVEESYANVDFHFDPLPSKDFETRLDWTRTELEGYLASWSAVQHYIRQNGVSPVEEIRAELNAAWPDETERKDIRFPAFLRMGRIVK